MSNKYEQIIYEKGDRIARITLNNPRKLNAMTPKMEDELRVAFTDCQSDDDVRVLVITGAGRGFCSGEDLQVLMRLYKKRTVVPDKPMATPMASSPIPRFMIEKVEKPVIAAVNGVCAAAGYGLALASDIRIASENARFVHVYLKRSLIASGEVWFLPRLIGLGRAMHYILTASDMDAQEALRVGLVSKVVPPDRLNDEVTQMAASIAAMSPTTVKFTKKAIYKGIMQDLNSVMEFVGYARDLASDTGETVSSSAQFLDAKKAEKGQK